MIKESYVRTTTPTHRTREAQITQARKIDQVCSRDSRFPAPLESDVVADVRIFFNAGWRLSFDVIFESTNLFQEISPRSDPVIRLSLLDCESDDLIFRELVPSIRREKVMAGEKGGEPGAGAGGSASAVLFTDIVNHMFEDDHYDEWKGLYDSMDRKSHLKNVNGSLGKWNPFNTRDSQMTLQICYIDRLRPDQSYNIGAVHFVLIPSDGLEFVVFAIIGLVGIPMLLMIGFRCVAAKHARLRQHIVKCVTTNRLFTQQLIHWLHDGTKNHEPPSRRLGPPA